MRCGRITSLNGSTKAASRDLAAPMSFPIAGRCEVVPFGSSNLLRYQQASGLDFIDVQMQKIRYIRAFRENPTQFRHEQKCCGMTNFDGIRCQE